LDPVVLRRLTMVRLLHSCLLAAYLKRLRRSLVSSKSSAMVYASRQASSIIALSFHLWPTLPLSYVSVRSASQSSLLHLQLSCHLSLAQPSSTPPGLWLSAERPQLHFKSGDSPFNASMACQRPPDGGFLSAYRCFSEVFPRCRSSSKRAPQGPRCPPLEADQTRTHSAARRPHRGGHSDPHELEQSPCHRHPYHALQTSLRLIEQLPGEPRDTPSRNSGI